MKISVSGCSCTSKNSLGALGSTEQEGPPDSRETDPAAGPVPASYQFSNAQQITTVQFNPYMVKIVAELLTIRRIVLDDTKIPNIMSSVPGLRELFYRVTVRGNPSQEDLTEMEILAQATSTELLDILQRKGSELCQKIFIWFMDFIDEKLGSGMAAFINNVVTRISINTFNTGNFCDGIIELAREETLSNFGATINDFFGYKVLDLREKQQKLYGESVNEKTEIESVLAALVQKREDLAKQYGRTGAEAGNLEELKGYSGGAADKDKDNTMLYIAGGVGVLAVLALATSRPRPRRMPPPYAYAPPPQPMQQAIPQQVYAPPAPSYAPPAPSYAPPAPSYAPPAPSYAPPAQVMPQQAYALSSQR